MKKEKKTNELVAINAVCPYFTMFPLDFPLGIIREVGAFRGAVVDPFCGRGTTNFAARLARKKTIGIDSNPVATAIAEAKMCNTTPGRVIQALKAMLSESSAPKEMPEGKFWSLMYHPEVLLNLCKIRESLLLSCSSDAEKFLRAVILGALHGPLNKNSLSYFSNQCPRTYGPKPDYSVKFWERKKLLPPRVSFLDVVKKRAVRYLVHRPSPVKSKIIMGDSREVSSIPEDRIGLVVTSPPYYGMRTYIQDQWIRSWFLGGPSVVNYSANSKQMPHTSPECFSDNLRKVWRGLSLRANKNAKMVIRFGGINDRKADHVSILKKSLTDSGWDLYNVVEAGDSSCGKRQADQFMSSPSNPRMEHDFYAIRI